MLCELMEAHLGTLGKCSWEFMLGMIMYDTEYIEFIGQRESLRLEPDLWERLRHSDVCSPVFRHTLFPALENISANLFLTLIGIMGKS